MAQGSVGRHQEGRTVECFGDPGPAPTHGRVEPQALLLDGTRKTGEAGEDQEEAKDMVGKEK